MSDDIGHDVLATRLNAKNGAIAAQLGDCVSQESVSDDAEWFQHVGFASRPSRAEPGKSACQVLSTERTDRDVVYASRDLRGTTLYGALGEGETCLYANGPNGSGTSVLGLRDDGSTATISIATKQGNASGGSAIKIEVSSTGNIVITAGSSTITVDQGGTVNIDAVNITLGGTGGTNIVKDAAALQAWVAIIGAGVAALGVANTPPTGLVSTTTKAV